jgi:hypothetical protein
MISNLPSSPGRIRAEAPESSVAVEPFTIRLREAKAKAEASFRKWEKAKTRSLPHLDSQLGPEGKNTNFLLPKFDAVTMRQIAEQSVAGKDENVLAEVARFLKRFVGRPLDKLRFLKVKPGTAETRDEVLSADLEDERGLVVDPASGKVTITSNFFVSGPLHHDLRNRYAHLFRIME